MAGTPSPICSSSSSPLPPNIRSSPHFTPIQEEETEKDERESDTNQSAGAAYLHQPTPLHQSNKPPPPPPPTNKSSRREDVSVSCSKCRPSSRDKISVVPIDLNGTKRPSVSGQTPNGLLRSIFGALARKSPLHIPTTPSSSASEASGEWKIAAAELSKKLIHVTRKRDEALLEASRLKNSMSELENKLNRLESYCRNLRASLDRCNTSSLTPATVEPFLLAVNDARSAVRHLSRNLLALLRASPRAMDRLGSLLHTNGLERQNPWSISVGLESALNRVFYSDFERAGEGEGKVVDPAERCAANRAAYETVRGLGWEDVLSKGTRHYSEGLSRFCDWKMSEVVAMLGWARAWPESLLQAFFNAARGVWAVHLLARTVHPALPILRVDRGAQFDPRFMEDLSTGKPEKREVAVMVAPGFYVQPAIGGVVKCTVVLALAEIRGSEGGGGPENGRVQAGKV